MNYYNIIQEKCKNAIKSSEVDFDKTNEYIITSNLFSILGEQATNSLCDNLFTYYFKEHDMNFDEAFVTFHKSLRQSDIFENGHLDMIFHSFIYMSSVPYDVMKYVCEKIYPTGVKNVK